MFLKTLVFVLFLLNAMGCTPSVSQYSDEGSLAELIIAGQLTEEEFAAMQFSQDELMDLVIEVGLLNGADFDGLMDEIHDASSRALNRSYCQAHLPRANLSGDTFSYSYWQDSMCDGDPSDVDWVFNFAPNWSDAPSNFRWESTNWWVRTTFNTVYGGLLLGSSLCQTPVQICLGTNGVTAAGGAGTVANSLYISH